MRVTVPSAELPDQTEVELLAMSKGASPTLIVELWPFSGVIRVTVSADSFATQSAPSRMTMPTGSLPAGRGSPITRGPLVGGGGVVCCGVVAAAFFSPPPPPDRRTTARMAMTTSPSAAPMNGSGERCFGPGDCGCCGGGAATSDWGRGAVGRFGAPSAGGSGWGAGGGCGEG